MTDRWTVRAVPETARAQALELARAAGQPVGAWLGDLIGWAAIEARAPGAFTDLQRRVDAIEARIGAMPQVARKRPAHESRAIRATTLADSGQSESYGLPCAATGRRDSGESGKGSKRPRLAGSARAERDADIRRRLDAGESSAAVATVLGVSVATVNRVRAGR